MAQIATTPRMKVTIAFTVEVDRDEWAAAYGSETAAAEVREEVRSYFRNHIQCAEAVGEADLAVSFR